ncbi:MAG: hypothetical protein OEU46_21785 [Alphaproteobacteria bacterium]|nr:hypothetical protein [Alphaproteobacteria bacterium]
MAALAWIVYANPASADDEAGNVAHVAAGPYGRCYARSIPRHIYDPDSGPRQQGRTEVYRVGEPKDVLEQRYDWFSQTLFVRCRPGRETVLVRLGPWHRGHEPRADHLAIAFYRDGKLIRRYSTLAIAGGETAKDDALSKYKNVSASVSHYTVFAVPPKLTKITKTIGSTYKEDWMVKATTIDGRGLTFDIETGEMQ